MNEVINWAAHNNTLMIQIAFSVVLVLIVIYLYRLFFVSSISSNLSDSSVDLTEVNQKLNQLLQQQNVDVAVPPSEKTQNLKSETITNAAVGIENPALAQEIEQLKAENSKLKTQLNESEKKVFEMTPTTAETESAQKKSAADSVATSADNSQQVVELNKKIEELQSRLSEYDIIADDIAELSQLRSENAELKKQISGASGFDSILSAVPQSQPVQEVVPVAAEAIETVVKPEVTLEPAPEPEIEKKNETSESAVTNSPTEEVQIAKSTEAQSETPNIAESEVLEAAIPGDEIVIDQTVDENDKSLIDEFDRSTPKG